MVAYFGLGGWGVSDWLEETSIVEPIDPFEGGELDGIETAPRSPAADDFRLEQTDHALRQRVVVGIVEVPSHL